MVRLLPPVSSLSPLHVALSARVIDRGSELLALPAMAPPLRPEEGEDEPPSEPVEPEPESLGGIATMCCWAPGFQVQAETLKTLRS